VAKKSSNNYETLLKSANVDVRRKAVDELAKSSDPSAPELLIRAMGDDNETIIQASMKAMTERGEASIPGLIAALKNRSWTVRKNASKVLVRLGEKSLESIIKAMYSDDDDVQFWASEVLSEFGESAIEHFVKILDTGSQSNRVCAINALGKTGSPRAVEPLIGQLKSDSWSVRKAAAEALWEIGQPAVEELLKSLRSNHPDLEFWSIQVLGEIGDPAAVPALIEKLVGDHLSEEKRISIIKALGEIEDPQAIQTLVGELGHSSWFVRRAAGEALWQIGPAAIPELIQALGADNVDVRYWASKVLGEMQAKEAVEPLIALLDDKEWSIRSGVAYSLGEIGDERAAEALLKHLEDPNEIVRKNIVIALGQIGDAKAIKSSEAALDDESDWVRRYAAETLEKIKEKKVDTELAVKRKCGSCHVPIEEEWKFCPHCGKSAPRKG
jgi:HEAT repeat protein